MSGTAVAIRARRLIAGVVLAGLAACGGGSSVTPPTTPPPPDGLSVVTELTAPRAEPVGSRAAAGVVSGLTGGFYALDIYLPAGYAQGSARYPVIYVTDGDANFPPLRRFDNFMAVLQRRGTPAILVGIGDTQRRAIDLALPGALSYRTFLVRDLVPFIESRLRADPRRRMLSGLSLGGSFVVSALLAEAATGPAFSHYISAEGAFWQSSFIEQEQQVSDTLGNRSLAATLILAHSSLPGPGTNGAVTSALYNKMRARNYNGLQLIETSFANDHVGVDNPSFEDAVIRIFEGR